MSNFVYVLWFITSTGGSAQLGVYENIFDCEAAKVYMNLDRTKLHCIRTPAGDN